MFDPRWESIAKDWLADCELPPRIVDGHWLRLAQSLADVAEHEISEIKDYERASLEAARDAHENQQLDELKGK